MSNEKSCEKTRSPASGRLSAFSQSTQSETVPKEAPKGSLRWVHESDEVALTTEPRLDLGATEMIGGARIENRSPLLQINLESEKPRLSQRELAWPPRTTGAYKGEDVEEWAKTRPGGGAYKLHAPAETSRSTETCEP